MTAAESLRMAVKSATDMLMSVMAEVTDDQAVFQPGGTANAIAPTLRHIVEVHDRVVNRMIRGGETIWEAEGWAAKVGAKVASAYDAKTADDQRIDLAAYREYAAKVFAASDDYLANLTDAECAREITSFRGPTTVGNVIGRILITHCAEHTGEIAAVKGLQGLKGLR
jgi:uncharacterized damage-inducible protein DinB